MVATQSSSYDLPYNYSTIRCYGAKDPETRDWQITGCGVVRRHHQSSWPYREIIWSTRARAPTRTHMH